jgi:capsule biosynthesis phosphatase
MKRLIFDVDETICTTQNGDYKNSMPILPVIEKMREYKAQGFEICLSTSRNMRTYEGNAGKIAANTLPILIEWLQKHEVPYDEIYFAKPWCGFDGFYIDDKAIRPDEFINLSYEEIRKLTSK